MGSSDRPSQDAVRDSGEEYDGTDGGGEELESSHRPDTRITDHMKLSPRDKVWDFQGDVLPAALRYTDIYCMIMY